MSANECDAKLCGQLFVVPDHELDPSFVELFTDSSSAS